MLAFFPTYCTRIEIRSFYTRWWKRFIYRKRSMIEVVVKYCRRDFRFCSQANSVTKTSSFTSLNILHIYPPASHFLSVPTDCICENEHTFRHEWKRLDRRQVFVAEDSGRSIFRRSELHDFHKRNNFKTQCTILYYLLLGIWQFQPAIQDRKVELRQSGCSVEGTKCCSLCKAGGRCGVDHRISCCDWCYVLGHFGQRTKGIRSTGTSEETK